MQPPSGGRAFSSFLGLVLDSPPPLLVLAVVLCLSLSTCGWCCLPPLHVLVLCPFLFPVGRCCPYCSQLGGSVVLPTPFGAVMFETHLLLCGRGCFAALRLWCGATDSHLLVLCTDQKDDDTDT